MISFLRAGILVLFLIGVSTVTIGQSIQGKIPAKQPTPFILLGHRLHQTDTIVKSQTKNDGRFVINMPANAYHGIYTLAWPQGNLEILFGGEPIQFDHSGPGETIISQGEEWKLLEENRKQLLDLRNKQMLLIDLKKEFSDQKKLIKESERSKQALLKNEDLLKQNILAKREALFARYLLFEWPFVGRRAEDYPEYQTKERYLELLDLSDSVAYHHHTLPRHFIEYFKFFSQDENANPNLVGLEFAYKIMAKIDESHPIYFLPTIDFLRQGLEAMGMQAALQYLAGKVEEQESCSDTELQEKLKGQLDRYLSIMPGKQAPALVELVDVSNLGTSYTPRNSLLVFYSTSCTHCQEQLPKLHAWWQNKAINLEVAAINLDASSETWKSFIAPLNGWRHMRDPNGNKGQTLETYLVFSTPKFVWVDEFGRIKQVFHSLEQIQAAMP